MGNGAEKGMPAERCELWHKWLADNQRLGLPLPSVELLLGTFCPAKEYLSQHSLQLGGCHVTCSHQWNVSRSYIHSLQYKVSEKPICFLHLLFLHQPTEESEAQEEGRAMREKEPGSLSDFTECCPLTKVMKNKQEIREWNHWDFRDSMWQMLILFWLIHKSNHFGRKEMKTGRPDYDPGLVVW